MATTLNPAGLRAGLALSGGDLTCTAAGTNSGGGGAVLSTTSKTSGKWYFELTVTSWNFACIRNGIAGAYVQGDTPGRDANLSMSLFSNGVIDLNSVEVDGFSTHQNMGDTIGFAIDVGNKLWWSQDLTTAAGWSADLSSSTAGDPNTGSHGIDFSAITGPYFALVGYNEDNNEFESTINFGGSAFVGSPPSGFSAWDSTPPVGAARRTSLIIPRAH